MSALSCVIVSLMQVGTKPRTGDGLSRAGANNPRVINMLRGGILYVKLRKDLDMAQDNEDGLPSSARQVGAGCNIFSVV